MKTSRERRAARLAALTLFLCAAPALGASPGGTSPASSTWSGALAKSTRDPELAPELPPIPLERFAPPLPSESRPSPPAPQPQPEPADSPAPSAEDESRAEPATNELGISVGVPYFDDEILRPDVTVEARYARRLFDVVVPAISVGYRLARLDPKVVPDEVYANQIESPFASLGLRFEAPLSKWFQPFAGGAADLAWWSTTFNTGAYCKDPSATWYPSAWGCYDKDDWGFAPVYRGQVGFLVRPEPSMALEFVAEAAIIPAADMFTRQVTLLTPSVGFSWFH